MDSTLIKVKNLVRIVEAESPSFAKNLEARADLIDSYKKKISVFVRNYLFVKNFKNINHESR